MYMGFERNFLILQVKENKSIQVVLSLLTSKRQDQNQKLTRICFLTGSLVDSARKETQPKIKKMHGKINTDIIRYLVFSI